MNKCEFAPQYSYNMIKSSNLVNIVLLPTSKRRGKKKKRLSNTDSGIKNECFLSRFSNFRNFENEIKSLNICEKHC